MIPLTQQEKNKVYEPMYRQLEKLENKLIKIGIDYNDPKSVELNDKLLAQYEEIEKTISYIQFHDIYQCIVPKNQAKKGHKFRTIPDKEKFINGKYDFEIVQPTNRSFSVLKNGDCRYVLCKYIGDN